MLQQSEHLGGAAGRGGALADWRRLLRYLRPYRLSLSVAVGLVFALNALRVTQPKFTQYAIDLYIVPRDLRGLHWLALIFAGVLLLSFLFQYVQNVLLESVSQRVMYDLRNELYEKIQQQDVAYFDRTPTGRIMTGITSDVETLDDLFTSGLTDIFGGVIRIASVIVLILWMDVWLTLVTLLTIPLFMLATTWFVRRTRHGYDVLRTKLGNINAFMQEQLAGAHVVQLFNHEAASLRQFHSINDEYHRATVRPIIHHALFFPLVDFISAVGVALIIWFGGWRVMQNTPALEVLSIGALVAFIQYLQQLFQPIRDISDKYNALQASVVAARRIFRTLDLRPDVGAPARPKKAGRAEGRIEFRDVWFAYGGEDWVLKGVSFVVEAGQSVAFIGYTGAGKTTLTSLLMRFYDVQRGAVLIGGVDVRDWDLRALRQNFAAVAQDVLLFTGTIESNIRLGRDDITEERVRWAAREVCAEPFILALPEGYQTEVMERGAGLSVGQKQLISFARSLACEPAVLILDEATGSIDTGTEQLIQQALGRVMSGRTSLVVTHRLTTIRKVSAIVVLQHGEVCEQGTHEELIAARGVYWKLYRLQSLSPRATAQKPDLPGM